MTKTNFPLQDKIETKKKAKKVANPIKTIKLN